MFGGVKITLILCTTIVVSCILVISHNEYTNRYHVIATGDNSVYIFDKKSTVLNKCDAKGCSVIETRFPSKTSFLGDQVLQTSKLFESEKPMTAAVKAQPATANDEGSGKNGEKNDKSVFPEPKVTGEEKAEKKEKESPNSANSKEKKDEDEFVE
ncbi:MAG: hypothetical protein LBB34_01600 [Holosporales bacterium]|jgi:hypothetical protein|nr:hypothetical protein [Holosporales bacterium]